MENYLFRNQETRKYVQEQAYRLQQGIVTTTTQQVRTSELSSHTDADSTFQKASNTGCKSDNTCEVSRNSQTVRLCFVFFLQMINRICVKVQDHLNSLKNSEQDAILEDVRMAENLIKDARNSKTVKRIL